MIIFILLIAFILAAILIVLLTPENPNKKTKVKNADKAPSKLMAFLEKADDAYLDACIRKDITRFADYATLSLCHRMYDTIYDNGEKLLGYSDYCDRSWEIISINENQYVVKKELKYKHIKMKNKVLVPLADDTQEIWKIRFSNGIFRVESIDSTLLQFF